MKQKKNPKYDLENKRGSFFLTGLWVTFTLLICAFVFSGKTELGNADWVSDLVEFDMEEIEMEEEIKEITPPPPPPPEIEVVEPDVEIEEDEALSTTTISSEQSERHMLSTQSSKKRPEL